MEWDKLLFQALQPLCASVQPIVCVEDPTPDEFIIFQCLDEPVGIYSGDQDEQKVTQIRVSWYRRGALDGCGAKLRAALRGAGFLILDTLAPWFESTSKYYVVCVEAEIDSACEGYKAF